MAIRETLEREVKLRAGEEFRLPELGGEAIEPRVFVSTYHDTADHRLARRGVTLRHRVEHGKGLWQLKLPQDNARLELEAAGGPGSPPDDMLELLVAHLRGAALVPIARLRTRREGVRADGAEIVHDTVAVLDHQRVTRSFEELEVELLDGDEKTLRRIEKELRRAGAADGESRPKVFQALDLDFQPELVDEPRRRLERRDAPRPHPRAGRACVRARSGDEARHRVGGVASAAGRDPPAARVPPGRTGAVDPIWADPVRTELKWLGGVLGPVRDLDVLIEHLTPGVESLGTDRAEGRKLLRTLERKRRTARKRMMAALDSDAVLRALGRARAAGRDDRRDADAG